MYTLHYNNRTRMFIETEFEEFEDLRVYVVEQIKAFLLDETYNVVFEPRFNRVQVWDDESEVLEYRWFRNE